MKPARFTIVSDQRQESEAKPEDVGPGNDGDNTAQVDSLKNDSTLWREWKQGEEQAFAELVNRYSKLVWNVCFRTLFRVHDAEDAFQLVFLMLSKHGDRIHSETFGPWLYRTSYHASLRIRDSSFDVINHEFATEPLVDTKSLLHDIEIAERNSKVDEAIEKLPEKLRAPFILFHIVGRSRSQISSDLEIAESTVKSRLQQARQKLKSKLTRHGITLSSALLFFSSEALGASVVTPRVIEQTISNVLSVQASRGLPFILENALQLEKDFIMSNSHIGLIKGAGITLAALLLIAAVSVLLGGQQLVTGAGKGASSSGLTLSSPPDDGAPNQIATMLPARSTSQAALASRKQVSPSNNAGIDQTTDEEPQSLTGVWSRGDNKIEFDEEENVVRLAFQMRIDESRTAELTFVGEYAKLNDAIVGVVLSGDVDGKASIEELGELLPMINGLVDKPFMIRIKRTKDSVFLKQLKVAMPVLASKQINDDSQLSMMFGFITGEYSKTN